MFDWLKAIIVAVIIVALVRSFLFSSYIVDGKSMRPTLEDGNKLVVNKISYQVSHIKRFDVIVFHANPKQDYVKRVIGVPGDSIRYKDDQLFINGKRYEEPYLDEYKSRAEGESLTGDFSLDELTGSKTVPEGKLFVMGDNRIESSDSRHFGFISMKQVVGKVDIKYWPLKDLNSQTADQTGE